jgi:pilus assembly protein Flp/PilA
MHHSRSSGESGATAVEYALMITFVAILIIAAVTLLGINAANNFADPALSDALQ